MIHYTLLPEKEIKDLKREYHLRVFIVLMFFASCAVTVGIISLLPAYLMSSIQEKDSLKQLNTIKKDNLVRGIDTTLNKLKQSSTLLSQLKAVDVKGNFSDVIQKFMANRPSAIRYNSIQISNIDSDSSNSEIIVQGKSTTREALLDFKKVLEKDPDISKIEFPTPDLTKSRDISFAIKMKFKK